MEKYSPLYNNIAENAKNILVKKKVILEKNRKKVKYSKTLYLVVREGYDICENLMLVRAYILKEYDVDLRLLEIFLYLGPKNYFTQQDFFDMPKPFTYNRVSTMLKKGHIIIVQKGKNRGQHIYQLSVQARTVVRKFYELLSGESKFPEDYKKNPMAKVKVNAFDKIKMDIMRKVNQLEPSETKKGLYQ
jgi:hypothetical protein